MQVDSCFGPNDVVLELPGNALPSLTACLNGAGINYSPLKPGSYLTSAANYAANYANYASTGLRSLGNRIGNSQYAPRDVSAMASEEMRLAANFADMASIGLRSVGSNVGRNEHAQRDVSSVASRTMTTEPSLN